MVLISRRALVVLSLFVLLATVFLGVFGYRLADAVAPNAQAVFRAQQFLYVALLLFVGELFLFVKLLVRSRNIERELDKLIEITRYRGMSSVQNLQRLGPIGGQIGRLYEQLNSLSDRKSLKISALSELTEFLMSNLTLPAVAATVDGNVTYVSRAFTERTKRSRNETVDVALAELLPGVSFSEIVAELDRSHTAIERRNDHGTVGFYPIRNSASQLSYIVCVLQGRASIVEQALRPETELQVKHRSVAGGVRRLIGLGRQTMRRMSGEERKTGGPQHEEGESKR